MGIERDEPSTNPHADRYWMRRALNLAHHAEYLGEVPIGALLVRDDQLIAEGWNAPIGSCDPSAHAEIVALRRAGQAIGNYRFPGCTLYVTLEPCVMCVGAMIHARIARLVFGACDPQRGAVSSRVQLADADFFNHRMVHTGGILPQECGALLRTFFRRKRARGEVSGDACTSSPGGGPSTSEGCYNRHHAGEVPKRS